MISKRSLHVQDTCRTEIVPSIPTKTAFLRFTCYNDIIYEIAAAKTKNIIHSDGIVKVA